MPTLGYSTTENAIAFDKKTTTYAKFDSKYLKYMFTFINIIINGNYILFFNNRNYGG